jgi:nicastrin
MAVLVLVSLFLFIVSLCGAVDPLLARVYHPLNARPCVRLLTAGGMSGCATPQNGLVGVVRAARSMSQLQALLNEADDSSDMIALVMDAEIAGTVAFRAAQTLKSRLAGIAIAARPASASFASTVDALTPLSLYAPSLAASKFAWNTAANSTAALLSDNYRFAMLQLSQSDTARAWRAAAENEAAIAAGSFAPHAMEFQYRMGARQNSTACLAEGSCMPLGGWSVWSELSSYNASQPLLSAAADTRPLVAGVASMDALSLFHAPVPRTSSWTADQMPTPASGTRCCWLFLLEFGLHFDLSADSVVSSLVSLLAAAEALGRSARNQLWNPAALPRRIGLFAFNAEAVGLLGSRNLLRDLSSFQCQSYIDPAAPEKGCAIPFQSDLAFTRLCSAVTSGNCFASVLELRQVGWPSSYVTYNASNDLVTNSTLFAHTQPEQRANGIANAPLAAVQTAAATLSDYSPPGSSTWRSHVRVQRAAADAPSVPPGSSWAFLGANATTPVLVLADHRREYVNQFRVFCFY